MYKYPTRLKHVTIRIALVFLAPWLLNFIRPAQSTSRDKLRGPSPSWIPKAKNEDEVGRPNFVICANYIPTVEPDVIDAG